MKSTQPKHILYLIILLTGVLGLESACCLKKITLTPEVSSLDINAAKAGIIRMPVELLFKDCCPTKKQKALALDIQTSVAELYKKLVKDEISREQYNEKIKAARTAIEEVILVCNAAKRGEVPPGLLSGADPVEAAWSHLAA